MNTPSFDEQLAFLNRFILELVDEYQAGKINSWDALDEKVRTFFTPERMNQIEVLVLGWKKMASYSDGITLTHVMCVFLGAFMLPEFQALTAEQQQMAKWIVLFHDVEKVHVRGKRDYTHGFRSAALTAKTLSNLGFPANDEFQSIINSWSGFTYSATVFSNVVNEEIQDNAKLPEILSGIEQMYGEDSPVALIIMGVLLHMSINAVNDWPQPAPLMEAEMKRFITPRLFPLLKVMMMGDNEGWSLFEPEVRIRQYNDTVAAFQEIEKFIGV
jgi:hypothetical protein